MRALPLAQCDQHRSSNNMVRMERKKYKSVLALHLLCISFALLSWPITVRAAQLNIPHQPSWYLLFNNNSITTRDISSSISYLFPVYSGVLFSLRALNPSLLDFSSTPSASSSRSSPSACSGPVPPPTSSDSAPPWRSSTCWAGSSPASSWSWSSGRLLDQLRIRTR